MYVKQFLLGDLLAQAPDGAANCERGGSIQSVGASSLGLVAGLALPDADGDALEGVLAAELAEVLGVLAHLYLLDDLTQGATVAGAVLAADASLLGALRHLSNFFRRLSSRSSRECGGRIYSRYP